MDRRGGLHGVRPIDSIGCHTPGHNHDSIAVCLIGGLSEAGEIEDNYTEEQRTVLRLIIGMFQKEYPEGRVAMRQEVQKRRGDNTKPGLQGLPEMVAAMKVTSKVNMKPLSEFFARAKRKAKPNGDQDQSASPTGAGLHEVGQADDPHGGDDKPRGLLTDGSRGRVA